MATLSKSVEIVFGAKNEAGQIIKGLESDFGKFKSTIEGAAEPIASFGNKLLAVETAVLAVSAAFVGSAIDAAGQFGDQINEIGTLFGGTSEQIGEFSGAIQDYGASSTQSLDSINTAIYNAVSAGVDYKNSVEFVSEAEKLAVAGRGDLNDTTKVLVSTLNAYGESTDKAGQYSDTLFTIVKQGQTTLPELSQSLSQVTSLASAGGVPFETLGAAIAALTASGVPTSEAMTKIRGAIETFVSPSSAAAKAAQELGVSLDTGTLKSLGFEGAMKAIYDAAGGSAEKLSQVFTTTEGLQAALTLGADKSGKFADSLAAMNDKAGATQEAFDLMSKNYEYSMQRMANAADVAMIKAGQPLLDQFGSVANGIAEVFNSLGQSIDSGAFDPIIDALGAFGESASDTLAQIAENLPEALASLDFSALLQSLDNLGGSVADAFNKIFGEIDLSTPEGLSSALQTIVDGIAALTNVTSGIIDSFDPIFSALGQMAHEAGNAGSESQLAAGQFIGVAQQIAAFGLEIAAAVQVFKESGYTIGDVVDAVTGGVQAAFNAVQLAADGLVGAVVYGLKGVVDALALITFGELGDELEQMSANLGATLDDLAARTAQDWDEMNAGAQRFADGISGAGGAAAQTAGSMGELSDATGSAADSADEFVGIDWSQSATGMDYVGEAAKKMGLSLEDSAGSVEPMTDALREQQDEADKASAAAHGYKLTIDELGNRTFTPVIEGTKKTAEETDKARKAMEAAAKEAIDYDLKLQEIASKERIAYVEAKLQLDQAQIEADTQKVVAAFDSINTSITSTGDTMSNLLSTWAGLESQWDKTKIWDLLMAEEKRRQEAFEQQKELVSQQIKYLEARTLQMTKGDSIIKIEAAGLTIHLEKIFQEVLRQCQIKANEQGLELLLGAS